MQGAGEGHEDQMAREPEIRQKLHHKDGSQIPTKHGHHRIAQGGEFTGSPDAQISGMGM
ncbi:MAG: hypothetical protein WA322_12535 [Pseudolabrys sp.]